MPAKYSIKDLERVSGIKAHTLRIWEQRYGILRPGRSATNIRYYSNTDLKRILNISLLNQHGYKISNIARLNDDAIIQEAEKLLNACASESNQVEHLLLCLMEMNEQRFEKIFADSIAHFGFENTIEKIIFPFLRHLGDLWQVSVVSAAQEHYISNLIRQKLISSIDQLNVFPAAGSRTYLLFLPGTELHELGLLYVHYLIRAKGSTSIYLGQSVPLEDLVNMSKKIQPDCLISIFTTALAENEADSLLKTFSEQIPGKPFLISGRVFFATTYKAALPSSQFRLFEDFAALKKML